MQKSKAPIWSLLVLRWSFINLSVSDLQLVRIVFADLDSLIVCLTTRFALRAELRVPIWNRSTESRTFSEVVNEMGERTPPC